jgi:type I restriction enzyme, S subunit
MTHRAAWRETEIEDLRAKGDSTLVGGPFGSDLTQSDYVSEPGVPVIRGTNLGGKESRFVDEGFVYVTREKADKLRRNLAFPGDVIFTQRGTLGQIAIIPKGSRFPEYVISQSQMKLTPDTSKVDARFLYQYFRTPAALQRLLGQTLATGVPHINLGILKRFPIPVPPLDEQRRIAEVLDRAEALRAKRRAALAQLDTLTQSIFLDLFGDPALNPKKWPTRSVGDIAAKFSDGPFGSNLKSSHYAESGVRVVRLQNIGVGEFVDDDQAFIDEVHFASLRKHECRPGDVLIGTMGDPNLRACIQPSWLSVAINKADCVQFRADASKVTAEYVCALLNTPATERMAHDLVQGQTRLRISMGRLRGLHVPVPPLALQKEFSHRLAVVERIKSVQRRSLTKLDALFASLQHRAFRGEL